MLLLVWSALMYFFLINLVLVSMLNWRINKEWLFPVNRSEQNSTTSSTRP